MPTAVKGFIKKAIAEQNGDRIFPFLQKCAHVITIIPKDPAVIADGGNEKILRDIFSVDIDPCESGTLDQDFRFSDLSFP